MNDRRKCLLWFALFGLCFLACLLSACATAPHDPRDPAILRRAPVKTIPLP